ETAGDVLGSLAFGRSGRDRPILLGRDVLVFGDDAFDRLGVLIPEQQVCSQLEIFGCIKGDKMDVVQRCDDVWHLVTTHLPGYQVKLFWLLLIRIAQQFEGWIGLVSVPRTASRNRGEQKVFCT